MKELIIKIPVQNRSKAKFNAILEASPRVLREFGFQKTTTAKIALEADVSIGTLYDYFSNKEAVLICYLDQELKRALDVVATHVKKPNISSNESLKSLVQCGVEFAYQQRDLIKIIFTELPSQIPYINLAESKKKISLIASDFFSQHHHNIQIKNKDVNLMLFCMTNIVLGFQLRQIFLSDENFSQQQIVDELTTILASYLLN